MLRIRQTLGLDCIFELCFNNGGHMIVGEMYAKMQALKQVAGKAIVSIHKMPQRKRIIAVRLFPRIFRQPNFVPCQPRSR